MLIVSFRFDPEVLIDKVLISGNQVHTFSKTQIFVSQVIPFRGRVIFLVEIFNLGLSLTMESKTEIQGIFGININFKTQSGFYRKFLIHSEELEKKPGIGSDFFTCFVIPLQIGTVHHQLSVNVGRCHEPSVIIVINAVDIGNFIVIHYNSDANIVIRTDLFSQLGGE